MADENVVGIETAQPLKTPKTAKTPNRPKKPKRSRPRSNANAKPLPPETFFSRDGATYYWGQAYQYAQRYWRLLFKRGSRLAKDTRKIVRKQPIQSLLIGTGAGLVIGTVLGTLIVRSKSSQGA